MRTRRSAGMALVVVLSLLACAVSACGEATKTMEGAAGTATPGSTLSDGAGLAEQEEDGDEKEEMSEPEKAARAWLALVDEGRYAESWSAAAALLRRAVTGGQWARQVGAAREPLGSVVSRGLASEDRVSELPGAPDGEYVVLVFESAFEHKRRASEQVTVMVEGDGTWRVAGYYIR